MSLLRLFHAETLKLRRSLSLVIVLAIPAMVFVMQMAMRLTGHGASDWRMHAMSGAAIWAYLLLPLTATALTALLAQVEHAPRAWSSVLTLPCPKGRVFAAKALLAVALMAVIPALLWCVILGSGLLAGTIDPATVLPGPPPVAMLAEVLARMWLAGLLVVAIQFIVATATPNFAAPIIVGIGGTFFAVAATSAKAGIYFPWLLPVNILASDGARATQAILTGALGGIVVMILGCRWLARRDWH
ncbi:ABC transporter permease [Lysobacter xanthus]